MDGSDNGSEWQSYDSTEESLYAGIGQAKLIRPLVSCVGVPDRHAFLPAEPQLNFAAPDLFLSPPRLSVAPSDPSIESSRLGPAPSILDLRFHRGDAPVGHVYLFAPPTLTSCLRDFSMDQLSVSDICERLGSNEDAVRKMAAFKLQSNVGDPSFAEMFILQGGLAKLKYLIMSASGNTLAYSLASFSRLLEVDKGWECVELDLIGRVRAPYSSPSPIADSSPRLLSSSSRIRSSISFEGQWASWSRSCLDPTILPILPSPSISASRLSSQPSPSTPNF